MIEPTYWRGNATPARRVRVRIGETTVRSHWAFALAGQERDAVEVMFEGKRTLIDDADGAGWRCVTNSYQIGGYSLLPESSIVLGER